MIDKLKTNFTSIYGAGDIKYYFSPGRINLIGEHIDYNGGKVLPCAINLGTYAAVRKISEPVIKLASTNFSGTVTVEISKVDSLKCATPVIWTNYVEGVIKFFKQNVNKELCGLEILISGDLPNSAGLSSSASLELLVAQILNTENECNLEMLQLVLIGKKAENEHIGVQCGIMDQYAVGFGKENSAILLDCNEVHHEYVNFNINDYKIVISNTNKKRTLADSKYNERVAECQNALKILKQDYNVNYLCELSVEQFENSKSKLTDEIIKKRTKHVVYENARVAESKKALNNNDLVKFGQLLNESHISLKNDYEVSCFELDTLVSLAQSQKGVLGSRMTGAGFGGCTISLVKEENIQSFIENVGRDYKTQTNLTADFYIANVSDGVCKLK